MATTEGPLLFQGVSKESKAFRLMTQMGWEEGRGLGKDQQGITSHIRVKTRKDNAGVGTDEQKKAAQNWTVNTHIFDNILKNLKVQGAQPQVKKDSSDDDSSDDDSVEAIPVIKKVARPQGRYKRREGGKLVKGYSATDLSAILGGQDVQPAAVQSPKLVVPVVAAAVSKVVESKEQVSFVEIEVEESISLPDIAADWWGTKYGFVRAGALGSKQVQVRETVNGERPSQNGRTQFSEQDQENLYNLVNDKATTGKKGLGQADRALKIGGVKVSTRPGQKKVFADIEESENEEAQDSVVSEGQQIESAAANKLEKKRKRDESLGNEAALKEGSKIKLKSLVSQLLAEVKFPSDRIYLPDYFSFFLFRDSVSRYLPLNE
uniref:G-patch domain-containing protein n=1 Tax=Physcomitrium patens TaxID=3218 RepID=A0A7I4D386_PHYPA